MPNPNERQDGQRPNEREDREQQQQQRNRDQKQAPGRGPGRENDDPNDPDRR